MGVGLVLWGSVLCALGVCTGGDKHSLFYLYTIQSKNYDCTAVTLLDDRQIDFYNSTDESRTAKQNWLNNIPQPDWIFSTEKLQYDRHLLNILIDQQMSEFGHSESDGHVLQWRHGCEGEQSSDGSLTVLNCINEFGYDGEDLIQFNCTSKTWITPEKKKNREREEKWSKIFDVVKKCLQCEDILKIYLQYRTADITQNQTPPDVHIFAKKSVSDSGKLNLTCLITGFYPEDVEMSLRKSGKSFPEHLITSSGVRPNDDGTYQLRKSVEIHKDDPADYYCYIPYIPFEIPMIKQWDGRCTDCPNYFSLPVSVIVMVLGFLICVLVMIIKSWRNRSASQSTRSSKGGRILTPSQPTSNAPTKDSKGGVNEPLLRGTKIAGDAGDLTGPATNQPEVPGTNTPEGPGTNTPEGPGTHPPEVPVTGPPEGPVTSPPDGPVTSPPEGPVTSPPEGPVTSPPEGPVTSPPDGLGTNPPEGPATSPTESPATNPHEGWRNRSASQSTRSSKDPDEFTPLIRTDSVYGSVPSFTSMDGPVDEGSRHLYGKEYDRTSSSGFGKSPSFSRADSGYGSHVFSPTTSDQPVGNCSSEQTASTEEGLPENTQVEEMDKET